MTIYRQTDQMPQQQVRCAVCSQYVESHAGCLSAGSDNPNVHVVAGVAIAAPSTGDADPQEAGITDDRTMPDVRGVEDVHGTVQNVPDASPT